MAREIGGCADTIDNRKAKFRGLDPNEATKLRHMEDDNGQLKKLVAERALVIRAESCRHFVDPPDFGSSAMDSVFDDLATQTHYNTEEASVTNRADEQRAVLVDFGTQEFEPEYEDLPFSF